MKGYVWYSFGSDNTGPELAKALQMESGKKAPDFAAYDVVVGWGCKADKDKGYNPQLLQQRVAAGQLRIINSPEAVEANRDKLGRLIQLRERKVSVPGFVDGSGVPKKEFLKRVLQGLDAGTLAFPILGLNANHKGFPLFCYTVEDVIAAFETPAHKETLHYFRSFCPGTEYRIHVFRDIAILAQKKVLAKNVKEACAISLLGKLKRIAGRSEEKVQLPEQKMLDWILSQVAEEMLVTPNHIQRSVDRGWILEDVELAKVPENAVIEAIRAVDAVGLDLGAVSITVDGEDVRVTNVSSAPSLNEKQTGVYEIALRDFCKAKKVAEKKVEELDREEEASPELLALLIRKARSISKARVEAALKALEKA